MESHFLKRAQKYRTVQPVTNVASSYTLGPTVKTQRAINTITNKLPKSTRRRHVKNRPRKKENHKKLIQFLQDTDNKASEKDDHTFAQFGFCYVGG